MFKELLKNSEFTGLFPVVVLIIFFFVFLLIFYITLRLKKSQIEYMQNLPFEKENKNQLIEEAHNG